MTQSSTAPALPDPIQRPSRPGGLTLRAKLIWGNMLIAVLAIAILGYYIYYRAQVTNALQASQLDTSVLDEARTDLESTITINANNLDTFFASMRESLVSVQGTAERLIASEAVFAPGTYWDARLALTQLPQGSWDNSNSDPGSIFIPAQANVSDAVVSELNTFKQLDFFAPTVLAGNPDAIAIYFGGARGETVYYPNVDLAALLPPDFDVTGRPWYTAAAPGQNPSGAAVWSVPYQDAAQNGLVITTGAPVHDPFGRFRGVIAMDIQLARITTLVSEIRVGGTGYALLIDSQNRLIALPEAGYQDFQISPESVPLGESLDQMQVSTIAPEFASILTEMNNGVSGFRTISLGGTERFVIYRPIPEVGYSLAIIVPTSEMLTGSILAKQDIARETLNTLIQSLVIVVVILVLALLATIRIENTLTRPLVELTRSAQEIADGNLDVEVVVHARDEIGTLAKALNTMTGALRQMIRSLEQGVSTRTQELERQTLRLRATAEIARDAASATNLDDLLVRAARLIQDRFNLYHTGLFMLDSTNEYAVLRASPSEAGQAMLANNHRLRVGEVGIVGYVAASGKPRIALDTGQDAVFFNNPLLPNTRSEIALPLIADNAVIGVLDVQSDQPQAFSQDDVEIMQVMADQLATAIEKARLLGALEDNIKELERTNQQFTKEGWKESGTQKGIVGYHFDKTRLESTTRLSEQARETLESGSVTYSNHLDKKDRGPRTAAVPVKLRGQTIGVVNVQFKGDYIPEETIRLIEAASDRLAVALENARLVQDSQRRANLEFTIGQLSTKIGSASEIDGVLKFTAQELGKLLSDTQVTVQLVKPAAATGESVPE